MAFSAVFSKQLLEIVDTTDEQLIANAIKELEDLMVTKLHEKNFTLHLDKFRWTSSSHTFFGKLICQLYENFCKNLRFTLEMKKTCAYYMEKKSICFLKEDSVNSTQRETIYLPCDPTSTPHECSRIEVKIR